MAGGGKEGGIGEGARGSGEAIRSMMIRYRTIGRIFENKYSKRLAVTTQTLSRPVRQNLTKEAAQICGRGFLRTGYFRWWECFPLMIKQWVTGGKSSEQQSG